MRKEIIKTDDYLLLVSDEKLKLMDWCYGADINSNWEINIHRALSTDIAGDNKNIVGHLPLNDASELEGVPILPKIEDEVEILAYTLYSEDIDDIDSISERIGFRIGYNKAKEKYAFTKEDIFDALMLGSCYESPGIKGIENYNELQELALKRSSEPKYPIAFECEMENYGYCEGCRKAGIWHCAHADSCGNSETRQRMKVIINLQGKTQLVGAYIFK